MAKSSRKTAGRFSLHSLNVVAGVVALVSAVAAALLMNSRSYQLFTGLATKDPFTGNFAPALHSVYDIELRWAVVVIMVLAAVVPLLAATRNRRQYEAALKSKVMLWRWIDIGIISALMLEVIALLSGVQDIVVLKIVALLIVVTALLSWLTEKHQAEDHRNVMGTYWLAFVTGALPWLLIASYAVGTLVWGMVHAPWYVYALYATTLLGGLNYAMTLRGSLRGGNYESTERRYQVGAILTKLAFVVILIVGLHK